MRIPPSDKVAVHDRFQTLPPGSVRLGGFIQDRIQQQAEYLLDEKTLAEMVDAIRKRPHRIVNGEATCLAEGEFWGKAVRMMHGVTYNIPSGVWHNIAMMPDDLVIILEKDNTHRTDVEYRLGGCNADGVVCHHGPHSSRKQRISPGKSAVVVSGRIGRWLRAPAGPRSRPTGAASDRRCTVLGQRALCPSWPDPQ